MMTIDEALATLKQWEDDKNTEKLINHIQRNGKVFPWVETEIRYMSVRMPSVRPGVAVCAGGVAAEARYNGSGGEDDISFGQAVQNYERG